jgi:hypothetical protein
VPSVSRLFSRSKQCRFRGGWGLARWGIVGGCGMLVVLVVGLSPVEAAEPSFSLDSTSGSPGQTITATGTGWIPNDVVRIFADLSEIRDPSAALASITSDSGNFSVSLTVPEKPAGSYQFTACQSCSAVGGGDPINIASFSFTILVPPPTVPPTNPPPTVPPTNPPPTVPPIEPVSTATPALPILLVAITLILLAASWWVLRRPTARWRRPTWEAQAEDEQRHGRCDSGQWYCHRGTPHLDLQLRRISELRVELLNSRSGSERRQIEVGDHVLAVLNRCLDHALAGSEMAMVRQSAVPAAQGCWREIQRNLALASGPCDVLLSTRVQGGQATCPFTLYQCRRTHDATSRWTRRAEWTGSLKDEKSYAVGVLRAISDSPAAGDAVTQALTDRFAVVIRTISTDSLLNRVRPDSEWELDLGDLGNVRW